MTQLTKLLALGCAMSLLGACQAASVDTYKVKDKKRAAKLEKCLQKDKRQFTEPCLNARAAELARWDEDILAAQSIVHQHRAVMQAKIKNCYFAKCLTALAGSDEQKALDAAEKVWRDLEEARPRLWAVEDTIG